MNIFDKETELYHKIQELHKQTLTASFINISSNGYGQTGPYYRASIHDENRYFAESEYFYKPPFEFFHLTSMDRMWSILNSRSFRFYNLHSSADPDEYAYAGNILGLTKDQIDVGKKYSYTFSFCPVSELKNKTVWEKYGSNFSGVAIIFSIVNDPKDWNNFHISSIKYNDYGRFSNYLNGIKKIEATYPGRFLHCDLSKLMCYHKTAKWEGETEVRIASYNPYKGIEEYWKYSKTEYRIEPGRNRPTNYIELPLWVDNESSLVQSKNPELNRTQNIPISFFDTRPKIVIKDILIGNKCGLTYDDHAEIRDLLLETIRFNYGYSIDLSYRMFEC